MKTHSAILSFNVCLRIRLQKIQKNYKFEDPMKGDVF